MQVNGEEEESRRERTIPFREVTISRQVRRAMRPSTLHVILDLVELALQSVNCTEFAHSPGPVKATQSWQNTYSPWRATKPLKVLRFWPARLVPHTLRSQLTFDLLLSFRSSWLMIKTDSLVQVSKEGSPTSHCHQVPSLNTFSYTGPGSRGERPVLREQNMVKDQGFRQLAGSCKGPSD